MKKKKRVKGKKRISSAKDNSQNQKLYEILLSICNFYKLEDFLLLKSPAFLKLCEVQDIHWDLKAPFLNKDFLKVEPEKKWSFSWSCPLKYQTNHYGDLIFSSFYKFPQKKKNFLKKISSLLSSSLHFMENKEQMENIKKQWAETFDSFPQVFCITDQNFQIIHSNQAFQKISLSKKGESHKKTNLFSALPFSIKIPSQEETEVSWLSKGEYKGQKTHWEISLKPLFLQKETVQAFLFLIKEVTEEMEMEKKLVLQAQDRELGFIKGSIAHELNNPIAGIKALLNIIEQQVSPQKVLVKDSLKEMEEAMDRCCQIIQQLLYVSNETEREQELPA